MIDLHCYILPGLDDGAGDFDDSVAMARQATADGIEAVCATPLIRHDHDVRIEELAGRRSCSESRSGVGPGCCWSPLRVRSATASPAVWSIWPSAATGR